MSSKVVRVLTMVGAIGWPVCAVAQAIPRHDVSLLLGWSAANRPRTGVPYDSWIGAWFTTASGGWYWSDHQKTEITVAGSGEGMHAGPFDVVLNSNLSYTTRFSTLALRTQLFSGAQIYQFFHNTYLHPFAGVGIEVSRERVRTETTEETYVRASTSPGSPYQLTTTSQSATGPEVRLKPRVFAVAGVKGYLSERTFIRADIGVSAARALDRVSWRIGGGFDF